VRFSRQLRYGVPPAAVHAMLADVAFREQVCRAQRGSDVRVRIEPAEGGMSVFVDQVQPADDVPSFARRLVGDRIRIVQSESWTSASAGSVEVTIPGKPGRFAGRVTLEPDGTGAVETVSGDVTVDIPLLGGRLERLVADLFGAAIDKEHEVGRRWLGGHRPDGD
jgi:hypothetical protein